MLPVWLIFGSALAYLLLLFAVASIGDRISQRRHNRHLGRPVIYALSLAIYCTSWTYFGSVGLAANRGLEFLGIYLGPILMFTLGLPVIRRIVNLAKSEKLTSIADFIAARYGKNPTVAGLVAIIAVIGTVPYIALQLKAVSSSVSAMASAADFNLAGDYFLYSDISLMVALGLALFAVIFGTRHTDATEHQDGLILAIAMESVVKLVAFTTVGLFVIFGLFGGFENLFTAARDNEQVMSTLSYETPISRWILLTVLSAFAIIMLPRQFHVTVVENRTDGELRLAGFLLPLYLVVINIFVLPVAIGGLLEFGGGGDADLYVLSLPLAHDMPVVTLLTFLGGFSAATAMVIVASIAVAIMISNDIVMPILLRQNFIRRAGGRGDFTKSILHIRRTSIVAILLLGYAYYRSADINAGLASIGLLSFAAIAQFAPALFGGLIWRQANARGAIAGLMGGIAVWAYFLFLPSLGGPDHSDLAAAALGFVFPGTVIFDGPARDPLVNAVVLSLMTNIALYVAGSLTRAPKPLERIQASVFIPQRSQMDPAAGRWNTRVTVDDLKQTVSRYLGSERTERSFHTYETSSGRWLDGAAPADMGLVRFSEQLLGSSIGSASARLVLSILFQRTDDTSADAARLLNEASEALQYNRDLLQSALGQMDQGITVFDNVNRLTLWNKRFRELLALPESVGQVGYPLKNIVSMLAERGDIDVTGIDDLMTQFLKMDTPFLITLGDGERIIEVRSNAMPDEGVVTTYADITQRVQADQALKRANETLELRVAKRTEELTKVNEQLAAAQEFAEEANIGKTRFLAAAGHDILQPLNAARLYSSSLVERLGDSGDSQIVNNIDSSLESVESILGAVLDISRLDTGAMKPQISSFALNDVLRRVATDFAPVAREKNLEFRVMPTSAYVRSDPNLLRRLIQNLVSNAIKYTRTGKILFGVRKHGKSVHIVVMDTGIGIPSSKFRTVFKEFTRLDEGARAASGLGLGLSIVDRIGRVLNHPVELESLSGVGTRFRVEVPIEPNISKMKPGPMDQAGSSPGLALDNLDVICVDNEPKILEGMKLLLEGWGCRVFTASSIEGAELLAGDLARAPDALIVDFHLDDGDGTEAVAIFRQALGVDIPAVLITADRSQEVRTKAESQKIGVQHKPIRPAALRAYLNQIAVKRRAAAE